MTGPGNRTPHPPEEYDVQVRRTIPYYDQMHRETVGLALALDPPPKVWLDTGGGTGTLVRLALDHMPGTRFILTDPSEGMLDIAKARLSGEERVRFLRPLRTQDLPGEVGETPDIITAVMCHHYLSIEEREKAVRVCHDLLPPGGAFVTFENIRPLTAMGKAVGMKSWSKYQMEKGRTKGEVETHMARFDTEYFPITVEEHLALLRRTGFSDVELLWCSHLQAGFYCIK
jgi:tRNA (cmo5U34)-methyltransferase